MTRAVGGEFPGGFDAWEAVNPGIAAEEYVREWGGELVAEPRDSGSVVLLRHGSAWPPPEPLDGAARPPFPTEALPPAMRELCQAVAASTQTPVDLAAAFAFCSLATLVGGRVWVSPWAGWSEPTNLWWLPVLPPGNRKSTVLREVAAPLREIERRIADEARPKIAEAETQKEIAEKRARRKAEEAAREGGSADDEAEAISLRRAVDTVQVPVEPRLLGGDVTPEKAAVLLAEQGGRLGILSAEGGLFGTFAGRYSTGGRANIDVFLQAWSGDAVTVDRMGRSRLYVARPALTLCLAVQPDVLRQVASSPELRGLGLLGRFLYALPPSLIGSREPQGPIVPGEVRDRWSRLLESLADLPVPDEDVTPTLRLSEEALSLFRSFVRETETRLHPDSGDLAAISDWGAKLAGTTARIAALMHLAHHGIDGLERPIESASIRGAIAVAQYTVPHALAAFGVMGARRDLGPADAVLRWIKNTRRHTFSVRDAWQSLKQQAAFERADDVKTALAALTEYGWVRETQQERKATGRTPSPLYEANPAIWAPQYPHNPQIESSGGCGVRVEGAS